MPRCLMTDRMGGRRVGRSGQPMLTLGPCNLGFLQARLALCNEDDGTGTRFGGRHGGQALPRLQCFTEVHQELQIEAEEFKGASCKYKIRQLYPRTVKM